MEEMMNVVTETAEVETATKLNMGETAIASLAIVGGLYVGAKVGKLIMKGVKTIKTKIAESKEAKTEASEEKAIDISEE